MAAKEKNGDTIRVQILYGGNEQTTGMILARIRDLLSRIGRR